MVVNNLIYGFVGDELNIWQFYMRIFDRQVELQTGFSRQTGRHTRVGARVPLSQAGDVELTVTRDRPGVVDPGDVWCRYA